MDKYEISLWEDYPDTSPNGTPFLNERKLCTIGSNTMRAGARAVEPKLVNNVNGTNTFTFKMYQYYTDEITGEKFLNPFLNLLINERKVKVLWKDKWYDLLIKNLEEDTSNKSITYTCKDSYITELSRNGYNLEYSLDLQNNTGTASELASSVLENSGWYFDATNSTKIIQKTEEAVYEVNTSRLFQAIKQSPLGDITAQIPSNKKILIFYSSIVDVTNEEKEKTNIQFLYASEGYATDGNDMLVLNGDCYTVEVMAQKAVGHVYCYINNSLIIDVNTANGISGQYRAERLVKVQISKYDQLFDRYVDVYTDSQNNNKEVYGYIKTEFSDPITVVNLIANPSKFTGLDGWIGDELNWGLYPKFTRTSSVTGYRATSYLKVNSGYVYNSAISSNQAYLTPSQGDIKNGNTGGFHKGEKYVFRVKAKINVDDAPGSYVYDNSILPIIATNNNYQPSGLNYFDVGSRTRNGDWNEYILTCNTSCPVNDIDSLGFFIQVSSGVTRWIEDIQFFKYEIGVTSYDPNAIEGRINPGEVSLQSVAKTIYRYYNADHNNVKNIEDLSFLYEGEEEQPRFVPVTNNYEKIATIEAKNSNRFNILQSIAESFECWVRFEIDHDETGKTTFNNEGLLNKKVVLVDYIGTDLGWSFEYGIDLKNIKRKIISDSLTTKVLVLPNDNTFAKNGFCTIARSNLNYTKENFVLDFGYYINQGLLNEQMINRDLYSSSNNYLGYYYYLHAYNKEYDEITDILVQKRTELTKQESQLTVLQAQYKAILEELEKCKADVTTLACTDEFNSEKTREYVQSHTDHTKVQSLMNTIGQLENNKVSTKTQLNNIENSVDKLKRYIKARADRQEELAALTESLHTSFFKKYARYIQEGTWQDSSYIDDDKYYIDAIDVAYTSSRPQLQYDINVMRLAALEDFSSKVFNVGDICYVIDRDFFGYAKDGITPYKLKIIISEVTSYFDTPEKDIIKVQNYKTQFDDLFQRITATTQSLQYAAGSYERAAGAIKPDKTLSFDLLQDTFDYNENWVLNASNQQVVWDSTGITITDDRNAALKLKMMAGGLFLSNDGGTTWKNAIRGDGISTDILTAGRINISEIYVYDGNHPTFRWDSNGINAYTTNEVVVRDSEGNIVYESGEPKTEEFAFSKYVRFDQFGIYGYAGKEDFVPSTEDVIWYKENPTTHELIPNNEVRFGLTWRGFFLHGESGLSGLEIVNEDDEITFRMTSSTETTGGTEASLEISTSKDIILKTGDIDRIQIGRYYHPRLDEYGDPVIEDDQVVMDIDYGIFVRDENGENIFNVSADGVDTIGGWNLTKDSFYHTVESTGTLGLFAEGKNWTILSPISSNSDLGEIGNPQLGTGEPSIGDNNDYYIIAGNKFGVTVDGKIYSAGGRIGGWRINEKTLYSNNIIINSNGSIKCAPAVISQQDFPTAREGIIYIVAENKSKNSDEDTDPNFTYKIITTLENKDNQIKSLANITIARGDQIQDTKNYSIVFNNQVTEITIDGENYSVKYISGILYVSSVPITNLPQPEDRIIYIIAENKTKIQGDSTPELTYKIIPPNGLTLTQQQINEIGITLSIQGSTIKCHTIKDKITISNKEYSIVPRDGELSSVSAIWNISDDGHAYFHDIEADGGYIAGWHIDNDKIWNDDGTTLSASSDAVYNTNRYTIVTNSLAASNGNIGGWSMSPSGFTGTGIGLFPNGKIKIGEVEITSGRYGLTFTGGALFEENVYADDCFALDNSNLKGLVAIYDSFLEDTYLNDITSAGSTIGTRENYLDWLHYNWGDKTPNEVRVEGANSVYVYSWTPTSGEAFYSNYRWFIPVDGSVELHGTDLDGADFQTTNQQTSLSTKNIDVTSVYNAGRSSVTVSNMWVSSTDYQSYIDIGWWLDNGQNGVTTIYL